MKFKKQVLLYAWKRTVRDGEQAANKRPTVNFAEDDVRKNVWSVIQFLSKNAITHFFTNTTSIFKYVSLSQYRD